MSHIYFKPAEGTKNPAKSGLYKNCFWQNLLHTKNNYNHFKRIVNVAKQFTSKRAMSTFEYA